MDDKAWQLLMSQLNDIKSDIVDIKAENKKQTSMINSLKITVAGISSTVTILVTYVKTKFFGG